MLNYLKKNNEIFFMLFGFVIFISIATGNIAMGLAFAYFMFYCYERRISIKNDFVKLMSIRNFRYYILGTGIFIISIFISVIFCEDVSKGLKLWFERWPWRFMLFLMPVVMIKTKNQAYKILYAIFAGFSVASVFMLYQYFMLGNTRANGFYGHPMMMGGLMCILLPVLLVCVIDKNMLPLPRILSSIIFTLGVIALICNGTRGAWIACALAFFVVMFLTFKRYTKIVLSVLLVFFLLGGCLATNARIIDRMHSVTKISTDRGNMARLYMWRGAVAMFNDHPVLGVGEGQYKKNMLDKYMPMELPMVFDHSHSIIFHMLCVDGIVGLLSMLFMFGCILFANISIWIRQFNPWSIAAFGATISLFIQGLTEYNIGQSTVMKFFWLVSGVLCVLVNSYDVELSKEQRNE